MEGIQTLKGSWPWPWPSIRPYGISSCSSHRPLPINQISFKLKKLFMDGRTYGWTDGRTDVRTGGRTFFPSILLGQLSEVDLTNWMQQAAIHMMIHPIEVLAFSHTVESWARKSKKQQLFNFLLTSAVDGKLINSSCSSSACLECFATRMSFSAWTLSNYKH